jgi:hypothetical protein
MARSLTIEGRFVEGGLTMIPQKDMKGNPKLTAEGKPVMGQFIGIAIPKKVQVNGQLIDNPKVAEYYAQFDAEARLHFPHLYQNANGTNSHPRFAMKWQDGDGIDGNGKSVANKPGFAGHWIIKCATQLRAANCYVRNSSGGLDQLVEPEKVIKKGFYVAVAITLDGNGVKADDGQAVPGLYVTPEQILFVAPGEEIFSGIDPNEAFAGVSAQPAPAGTGAVGGLSPPPQPGAATGAPPLPGNAPQPGAAAYPSPGAASPASGSPPMPGGALAGPPRPPAPAAGPVYIMQPSAQGASREDLHKLGWTDEQLVANGHMIIQ